MSKTRLVTVILGIALLAAASTAGAAEKECVTQETIPLEDPAGGHATLCVNRNGVTGNLLLNNLDPGSVYTVWFAYIDDPSQCADGPGLCGTADFGGENPLGVFGRFDSAVARANGRLKYWGRVRGLRLRPGSQVWLLVFGHGPVDNVDLRHRARQLLTPEDPPAGAPNLGNNVDGPLGYPAAIHVFVNE